MELERERKGYDGEKTGGESGKKNLNENWEDNRKKTMGRKEG